MSDETISGPAAGPATAGPAATTKGHTPATTSPKSTTKATAAAPKTEEPMDFNDPANDVRRPDPKLVADPREKPPSAAVDAPQGAATEAPKRRGRPPKDPNAAPKTPAAPREQKPITEMGLGELMREHHRAVAAVTKANAALAEEMPRLAEIAEAITARLA